MSKYSRGMASFMSNADYRNDVLAETHNDGAPDEQGASTEFLHHVERGRGGGNIDNVHNGRHQKRVVHAYLLEKRGAIVD